VWLKAQLENETGYQDFKDNQRKVQTNPGTVASWKFCADFSQKYFGAVSHVQVGFNFSTFLENEY
jgi:hypothetical protein